MVEESEAFWVWTYASGWKEKVPVLEIVMASTQHSDRQNFMVECIVKVTEVHNHLALAPPDMEELAQKMDAALTRFATWLIEPLITLCGGDFEYAHTHTKNMLGMGLP